MEKTKGIFEDRMEEAVNRALLFKEMLETADLMDVFGNRTEWYLQKLQSGLVGVLNDVTRGYLDAIDDVNSRLGIPKLVEVVGTSPEAAG